LGRALGLQVRDGGGGLAGQVGGGFVVGDFTAQILGATGLLFAGLLPRGRWLSARALSVLSSARRGVSMARRCGGWRYGRAAGPISNLRPRLQKSRAATSSGTPSPAVRASGRLLRPTFSRVCGLAASASRH